MCVIGVFKEGVEVKTSTLEAMWNANPHGAGFAVYKDGKWHVEKGFMSFSELTKRLKSLSLLDTADHPPFVLHCRVASVGKVSPSLTHPFPIKLREGIGYVFHNGTLEIARSLSSYYHSSGMVVPEGESDTSQLAKLISELKLSKEQLKLLVKEGGLLDPLRNGSRFCFCLPEEAEPLLIGDWQTYEGVLVSNTHFAIELDLPYGRRSYDFPFWGSIYEDPFGVCDYGVYKDPIKVEAEGLLFEIDHEWGEAILIGLAGDAFEGLRGVLSEEEEIPFILTNEGEFLIRGVRSKPDAVFVPSGEKPKVFGNPRGKKKALGKIYGGNIYYLAQGQGYPYWRFWGKLQDLQKKGGRK